MDNENTGGADKDGFDLEQLPPHVKKLLIRRFGSLENVPVEFQQMAERTMKKFMPKESPSKTNVLVSDGSSFEGLPSFVKKFMEASYGHIEKTPPKIRQKIEEFQSKNEMVNTIQTQKEENILPIQQSSLNPPFASERDNGLVRLIGFIALGIALLIVYAFLTGKISSIFSFLQKIF